MQPFFRLAAVVLVTFSATAVRAEEPDVPGDDIFGFTSATDVGDPGEAGIANENDGRFGKRSGRYHAFNTKYEIGMTVAPDWWIGGALFGARNYSRNVPDLADISRAAFDGVSFEIVHRIIKRSRTNPFAVTVAMEPRVGIVDGTTGMPAHSVNVEFKLFVDAVVIPDKLFWAMNLQWAPQRAEDPADRSQWLSSSSAVISSAIAYQVSSRLFVGAEVRYLGSYSKLLPVNEAGHAVYAGPTLLWKITDKVIFNTTFQPQIAGRSSSNPSLRLDLDNYERAQFRAKLSVALQK